MSIMKLKDKHVRNLLLYVITFGVILAVFSYSQSGEAAVASDNPSQQEAQPDEEAESKRVIDVAVGYRFGGDHHAPIDGSAVAGRDMCTLTLLDEGSTVEMAKGSTIMLPLPVCEVMAQFLKDLMVGGVLVEEKQL